MKCIVISIFEKFLEKFVNHCDLLETQQKQRKVLQRTGNRATLDSLLIHKIKKWREERNDDSAGETPHENPTLLVVNTETIVCECIGFPNVMEPIQPAMNFFILKPVNTWGKMFIQYAAAFEKERAQEVREYNLQRRREEEAKRRREEAQKREAAIEARKVKRKRRGI